MKAMNLYLCGVGGRGIAMLYAVMTRACLEACYQVMGVETHGLAQRGGTVVSHLRIGKKVFTPMVPPGQADIVIALERLEGLRGALGMLKPGGTLVYYNATLQPQKVRAGELPYPEISELQERLESRKVRIQSVEVEEIPDPRMQNVALLGKIASMNLIEGMTGDILLRVMKSSVPPHALDKNLDVFNKAMQS